MTPFTKAANQHQFIKDNWMIFNSLPENIQEKLLSMIFTSTQVGIMGIQAQVKLEKLKTMTDVEIIEAWGKSVSRT